MLKSLFKLFWAGHDNSFPGFLPDIFLSEDPPVIGGEAEGEGRNEVEKFADGGEVW